MRNILTICWCENTFIQENTFVYRQHTYTCIYVCICVCAYVYMRFYIFIEHTMCTQIKHRCSNRQSWSVRMAICEFNSKLYAHTYVQPHIYYTQLVRFTALHNPDISFCCLWLCWESLCKRMTLCNLVPEKLARRHVDRCH